MRRINDANWWASDEERTAVLMPYAERLVGSRTQQIKTFLAARKGGVMDHQLEERLGLCLDRLKRAIKAAHAQDATDEDIAVMLRLISLLERINSARINAGFANRSDAVKFTESKMREQTSNKKQ